MKICLVCKEKFDDSSWECPSCHNIPQYINGKFFFSPELSNEFEGFKSNFFFDLFTIEADNFWFKARNKLLIWALGKYFPNVRNFLEIGCGTGFVLTGIQNAFPNLSLYGSEILYSGLVYASNRLPDVELFQMDARNIPFEEEFDVIGAFDVLEHIEKDEVVLKQMFRALKPEGGIIITVPHHKFLWNYIDEYACHFRRYSAFELRDKVENAGFKIIKLTSFVSLLFPFMLISRLKKKSINDFDPMAEFNINKMLNILFEKILDFERNLICGGMYFPFGGSLLIVAHRKP